MTTPLKSEMDKSLMFDGIRNGSNIKRETELLKCKSYIMLLEDRIRHLETINKSSDFIIAAQERLLSNSSPF